MYISGMHIHICVYVYIHIYTTSLANPSQLERKTSKGSSSGKGLYKCTHLKCLYVYVYTYTYTYIQRAQPRITVIEKDLGGLVLKRRAAYMYVSEMHIYMYMEIYTNL